MSGMQFNWSMGAADMNSNSNSVSTLHLKANTSVMSMPAYMIMQERLARDGVLEIIGDILLDSKFLFWNFSVGLYAITSHV
jgi:hypothetical protein